MKKVTQPESSELSMRNIRLGRWGEDQIIQTLAEKNWQLLGQNVRTPFGEIDIIAWDGTLVHFIEVKTRSSIRFGQPEDALDSKKIQHFSHSAEFYMSNHPDLGNSWQLDTAAITVNPTNWNEHTIAWFENVTQ